MHHRRAGRQAGGASQPRRSPSEGQRRRDPGTPPAAPGPAPPISVTSRFGNADANRMGRAARASSEDRIKVAAAGSGAGLDPARPGRGGGRGDRL